MVKAYIVVADANEAFAPVPLAWFQATKPGLSKFNVNEGAIALRHLLSASGTKLIATLVHKLKTRGKWFRMQTMCEGAGIVNDTILEVL